MFLILSLLLSHSYIENNLKCKNKCTCLISKYNNVKIKKEAKIYKPYIIEALNIWSPIVENFEEIPIIFKNKKIKRETALAQAVITNKNYLFSGGNITINSRIDFTRVKKSVLVNIFVHEIGHILGIGTNINWAKAIVVENNKFYLNKYKFYRTFAVYNMFIHGNLIDKEINSNIPLDESGNHWSEEIFFELEIMSSKTNSKKEMYISSLTLAALEDLNHKINRDYNQDSQLIKAIIS